MRYLALIIYWLGNVIYVTAAALVLVMVGWLAYSAMNDSRELRDLVFAGLLAIGLTWLLNGGMKLHDWAARNREKPLTMKDL